MLVVKGRTVYVDLDDTLIRWKPTTSGTTLKSDEVLLVDGTGQGSRYQIITRTIEEIRGHFNRGHKVIIWSAGGDEWAEKAVDLLGIRPLVTVCLSKPDFFIDDKPACDFMPESKRRDYSK